ncbi:uncharacterized protein TNCV_1633581 [Trichonephila clavipes]|nr:uncharacterized protein TNCV_1633581 [Trichonephila clavipes]
MVHDVVVRFCRSSWTLVMGRCGDSAHLSITYSGFEPEPIRLQTESHEHHTGSTAFLPSACPNLFVAAVAEWYRYRIVACLVTSWSPVPLVPDTRRVGQRCTLNLSRAETSSLWCGEVVRRGRCQLGCRPRHLTLVQNYVVRRQKPSCS